jgi:hypothetical protein
VERTQITLIFAENNFLLKTKYLLLRLHPTEYAVSGKCLYLNTLNVESVQADLGIEVILKLFSKAGLGFI